jgi:serine/threonine protein kinase
MDPRILFRLAKVDHQQDFGYEEKADIYSLGVICYILLSGKPLFDVDNLDDLAGITKKGVF